MESAASAATGHNYAMHDACNYYYNYYYTHLMASFPGQPRYPKGKTSLDLNEARDDGFFLKQWHPLDHIQTICTLLQSDNHTNNSSLNFFTG